MTGAPSSAWTCAQLRAYLAETCGLPVGHARWPKARLLTEALHVHGAAERIAVRRLLYRLVDATDAPGPVEMVPLPTEDGGTAEGWLPRIDGGPPLRVRVRREGGRVICDGVGAWPVRDGLYPTRETAVAAALEQVARDTAARVARLIST